MNRRSPVEERPRQTIGVLTLTIALSITICVASTNKAVALQSSTAAPLLEQDRPVERNIVEGETHSYGLTLKAGEFVHVVIRRLGVNVAATLLAPDGKRLVEADSPLSTQEAEWITYFASAAGPYRVDVRTVDKGAPAGRYEIKIEEQRTKTAGDETRLSAQALFCAATQLFREKNYRGAVDKYQVALAIYHRSIRPVEEAVTLNSIARASALLNDYKTAIERCKQALQIYRDNKDLNSKRNNSSRNRQCVSEQRPIRRSDQRSRTVTRSETENWLSAWRGWDSPKPGLAYGRSGRQEKAIDYFEQALKIFQEIKDRSSQAENS